MEYLFRGKTPGPNRRWAYGSLITADNYCCILENEADVHPCDYPFLDGDLGWIDGKATPVDIKTVGRFTGLSDRNDKNIYDGDIVRTKYGRLCVVVWFCAPPYVGWDFKVIPSLKNCHMKCPDQHDLFKKEHLEVVGNIHDNPELME